MAAHERARDRGERNAGRELTRIGDELRDARLTAGLSQHRVARSVGLTQSRVSRTERGRRLPPRLDELAVHAAALGLRLSLKTYPEGPPVRDAAQLRLLERFRSQLDPELGWQTEVMVGGYGDLRAWDAVIIGHDQVGVDAETRLRDLQSVQRRVEAKLRDSGVALTVLLVASTHHNRAVLRDHRPALASTFPLDTASVMRALRSGRLPPASGIVIL
jgi:transcriptional regulator with XRE-family HTH domain